MQVMARRDCTTYNVVVDSRSFLRIRQGVQKVVFEYFERKRLISQWYDKSFKDGGKQLVVKVWCEGTKKGNKNMSFVCDAIWDTEGGSWMGWLPDESSYDCFDEPAGDHFVLYLGERVKFGKAKRQ